MDEIPANRADPLVERVYSTTYVVHSSFAGLEIGLYAVAMLKGWMSD